MAEADAREREYERERANALLPIDVLKDDAVHAFAKGVAGSQAFKWRDAVRVLAVRNTAVDEHTVKEEFASHVSRAFALLGWTEVSHPVQLQRARVAAGNAVKHLQAARAAIADGPAVWPTAETSVAEFVEALSTNGSDRHFTMFILNPPRGGKTSLIVGMLREFEARGLVDPSFAFAEIHVFTEKGENVESYAGLGATFHVGANAVKEFEEICDAAGLPVNPGGAPAAAADDDPEDDEDERDEIIRQLLAAAPSRPRQLLIWDDPPGSDAYRKCIKVNTLLRLGR
jgi:hypothetical protein